MSRFEYAGVGFVCVGLLGAMSVAMGGQVYTVFGTDMFFPIPSIAALIIVFLFPFSGGSTTGYGLALAAIFLFQFLLFNRMQRIFMHWTMGLLLITTALACWHFVAAWDFAHRYYGLPALIVSLITSVLVLSWCWIVGFRGMKGKDAAWRLNVYIFLGLSWGALPYLGELP